MNNKKNFLLGYGERLTQAIPPIQHPSDKSNPYTFEEAIHRLTPKAAALSYEVDKLPKEACPKDETVGIFTLHPTYIARSYFPDNLLNSVGLRSVGSKASSIKPEKWNKSGETQIVPTVDLYVAGKREHFRKFAQNLQKSNSISDDIIKIEDIRYFRRGERIREIRRSRNNIKLEIALHASNSEDSNYILLAFQKYLNKFRVFLDLERRIQTNGLCFIPAIASYGLIDEIEKFSFLRVLREMPSLRVFTPFLRKHGKSTSFKCILPTSHAIAPDVSAAIFDGGISNKKPELAKWVNRKKSQPISKSIKEGTDHGLAVTSSFLFGPIIKGKPLQTPFANVDHYRVLDNEINDKDDLFDVLPRITNILHQQKHEFINLSIGPDIPIEDDEVEVWTSVLDEIFSRGNVLATIAIGNNGELDRESGNARVMVPSDCVNGMAVGACNSISENTWERASYSCFGPGRSPGVVKPDVVAFGGSSQEPYYVLDPDSPNNAIPVCGTSFAAPTVLRMATGIRSHFGRVLLPLAIKSLLINKSRSIGHDQEEVGWGRIANNLEDIVVCQPGEVTVVYQGELEPSKFIRATIPIPRSVVGYVTITATLCFASETDPQDVCSYTRSGIEVIFRPHDTKIKAKAKNPKTSPFFSISNLYNTENELRNDAHKWETVMHAKKRMRGSSLNNPAFDIHYIARTTGGNPKKPRVIPYALVINIVAPKSLEIYDDVLRLYRNQLETLFPIIEIPITT